MSALASLPVEIGRSIGEGLDPGTIAVLSVLAGGIGMSIRNVFDSIMSDEDAAGESDDGDDLMGGGDDLGALGDFDDGDDEFGDFESDDLGEMGDGADTDELEHRLDELENEVGSLSSTVNTVRNENEQISETVDDVEENVRKLLDIYEMVTRGVNPFADDVDGSGFAGGGAEGSFGLFDSEPEETEDEALDEELAEADPDGFFDEDLTEEPEDFGEVAEFDDGDTASDDGDDGGDGGKSFQDLKDEYESGDADWADESDDTLEDAADFEGEFDDDPDDGDDFDAVFDDEDLADDELFDTVIEDDPSEESADAVDEDAAEESPPAETSGESSDATGQETPTAGTAEAPTPEETGPSEAASETGATAGTDGTTASTASANAGGKPYLEEVPGGPVREILTIEWLEFLVDRLGTGNARQALQYYERIGWLDAGARADLEAYLAGIDGDPDGGPPNVEVHTTSLEYLQELNGTGRPTVGLGRGGDPDGIQR